MHPSVDPPSAASPPPPLHPPPLSPSPPPDTDMIEYTKDGNISRMRSHAGNIPSLPQTKLCPLCPAKFTRTTHLNRHLRTHSNERSHVCDRCQSQFTRSDLLARHKRNCGDSNNAHRSRRKSCQACADSKIKCDQKQPCSKCQSRGRECVYRSAKSSAGAKSSRRSHTDPGSSLSSPSSPSESGRVASAMDPDAMDLTYPPESSPSSPDPNYNAFPGASTPISVAGKSTRSPSLSYTDTSYTTTSSYLSSASNITANGSRGAFAQEALDVQNHLNALFSNEMFDKFFSGVFPHDQHHNPYSAEEFLSTPQHIVPSQGHLSAFQTDLPYSNVHHEEQPFMAAVAPYMEQYANVVPGGVTTAPPEEGAVSSALSMQSPSVPSSSIPSPLPSELEYYLHLFFTKFLEQMPIVHAPTFNVTNKPTILISAMQACGALYVKTPTASNFIMQTLANNRDEIMAAFARKPTVLEDQIHLILAVCLLQTIGLFHERADQRAQSNIYHAMLVMMIRQTGLLHNNANWSRPILNNPALVQQTWRDWVCYETTKRALTLTFVHDCCHTIYYTLPPTFFRQEFNLHLPCDDDLWNAATSHEWLMELTKNKPGMTPEERLCGGPRVQDTFSHFVEAHSRTKPAVMLNPFSLFVLIHGILRKLFEDCLDKKQRDPHAPGDGRRSDHQQDEYTRVNPTIQYMLHNWLQSWLQSPDTPKFPKGQDPALLHDGLPYYWIAQVLLLAYQESLPPFASDNPAWNLSEDAKYGLMKEWFKHIRAFLRRGEQGPTLFWDELMKIRMDSWQSDIAAPDQPEGLLGFFSKR